MYFNTSRNYIRHWSTHWYYLPRNYVHKQGLKSIIAMIFQFFVNSDIIMNSKSYLNWLQYSSWIPHENCCCERLRKINSLTAFHLTIVELLWWWDTLVSPVGIPGHAIARGPIGVTPCALVNCQGLSSFHRPSWSIVQAFYQAFHEVHQILDSSPGRTVKSFGSSSIYLSSNEKFYAQQFGADMGHLRSGQSKLVNF